MRLPIAALALLLLTVGCSAVKIGEHSGAIDYDGSPKRIFIVNQLNVSADKALPGDFAAAIAPALAACNIAVSIYNPNPMELDAEAKIKAAVQNFKPDAVLAFHLTFRFVSNGATSGETYSVKLYDATQKREVWHGESQVHWAFRQEMLGASMADQLLRTMVGDNVIKTCPPFTPVKQG